MNYLAETFHPYYKQLNELVQNKEFLEDKGGSKYVELIAPSIIFSLEKAEDGFIDFESRKSPRKYVEKEKEW